MKIYSTAVIVLFGYACILFRDVSDGTDEELKLLQLSLCQDNLRHKTWWLYKHVPISLYKYLTFLHSPPLLDPAVLWRLIDHIVNMLDQRSTPAGSMILSNGSIICFGSPVDWYSLITNMLVRKTESCKVLAIKNGA